MDTKVVPPWLLASFPLQLESDFGEGYHSLNYYGLFLWLHWLLVLAAP